VYGCEYGFGIDGFNPGATPQTGNYRPTRGKGNGDGDATCWIIGDAPPPPSKTYNCDGQNCVEAPEGETGKYDNADCADSSGQSQCAGPPPPTPTYKCDGTSCVQAADGETGPYLSDDCDNACQAPPSPPGDDAKYWKYDYIKDHSPFVIDSAHSFDGLPDWSLSVIGEQYARPGKPTDIFNYTSSTLMCPESLRVRGGVFRHDAWLENNY